MRLAEKGWYYASDKDQYEPRRKQKDACGQADRHNGLLDQLPKRPDHACSINRLDTRSFQLIIEVGVLIRGEIELRGVLHDQQAAVHHEAVGKNFVEVVNCSRQDD